MFWTLMFGLWRETLLGMKLDEGQRRKVAEWIEQGHKLAEIQTKLASELGVSMTYMDVRFLIDDLKLRPKDPEPPAAPPAAPATPTPAPAPVHDLTPESETEPATTKVSTTIDQIARPGALVSGKVTFSDGQKAEWYLDQTGRLGMIPPTQGYRPPQADIAIFQQQLQDELAKMGL
jgi:hypothetical protein